jgi:hypothetical protein
MGTEAVRIHVAGNENQLCTAMTAVMMDGRKPPLFTIVRGKTERWEWGPALDHQAPHVSTHSPSGWMTMPAMLEWPCSIRSLREYPDCRYGHLILDGYATHPCDEVLVLADEHDFILHMIPPGLTDLLQPPDRSIIGALKAEYRAIDLHEMSQRKDNRMTQADFTAYLILAWDLVSEPAVHGWEGYNQDIEAVLDHCRSSCSVIACPCLPEFWE